MYDWALELVHFIVFLSLELRLVLVLQLPLMTFLILTEE